jgi:hypothetical protein
MRGLVLLLLTGILLCWLGILLFLPASAPDSPSAFAGAYAVRMEELMLRCQTQATR